MHSHAHQLKFLLQFRPLMAHCEINKQSILDAGLSRHISADRMQGRVESKRSFSRLSVEWPSCLLAKMRDMLFLIVSVRYDRSGTCEYSHLCDDQTRVISTGRTVSVATIHMRQAAFRN